MHYYHCTGEDSCLGVSMSKSIFTLTTHTLTLLPPHGLVLLVLDKTYFAVLFHKARFTHRRLKTPCGHPEPSDEMKASNSVKLELFPSGKTNHLLSFEAFS